MHYHTNLLTKSLLPYMNTLKFIVLLSLAIGITACNSAKTESNDHLVFRYNQHKNIGSLDPAFSKDQADIWATNALFNGLVEMDKHLNVKPSIAKHWQISDDALNYTFTIKNNIKFHKHYLFGKDSTRNVTAHDFEYSFNRLVNKNVASPGSWTLNKVSDFKAINDTVFKIKLKQPFPAFLGLLTMKYCSVVPKEIVDYYGSDFRSHPIGTGPFLFKRWEENIKLVFIKNPDYFELDDKGQQLPYLQAIAITFLPDKQGEFLQFIQGNIDFISGLDASYKDDILTAKGELQVKYNPIINSIRGPYLNTEYLGFNMDSKLPELKSLLLRQAINYGFDRKKMMIYLRNGVGYPARGGFIPKGLPGYNPLIGYSYQPEKAKQLLEKFKKTTGINSPKITITTTSNYLSFCEYIQRELQKIGLIININVIPAASLKSAKANSKLDIFRASWIADYPDAENYLSLFYSNNFTPNGPNYTHFKDTVFDRLYKLAYTETNHVVRAKLYSKMDSIVIKKAPIIPLFYDEVVRFTRKNITGLGINPINLLDLKHVKKEKTQH